MLRSITLSALMFASIALAQTPGFTCPITPASRHYGTPKLAVSVTPGPWAGLPLWNVGYRQKIVWFSDGYVWGESPNPTLTIKGRRLDGEAPPLIFDGANGSRTADWGNFIMSGVNFPTLGCWEITGQLDGTTVSYVVLVR
jgi:hypothetical protein